MHHSRRKSFDWYGLKQHFSIRKYHFGAASVLLGMSIALGTGTQVVQAAETVTTPESTSVASSTSATESTTSETSTETATSSSSERTVEIGYIVKYATEEGTLVNASVETVSVTTTETIAKATVSVTAVVPEGYELASGQSATVSQEVTENGQNIVTVKVVKKVEASATVSSPTTTSTTVATASSTTRAAASPTPTTPTTPTTVEEAKKVLEQVTSEAEVLANETNRLVAADNTNEVLKTAAAATKLVATKATVTFQNAFATLEEVNAQISAVRTSVEAFVLELRKYLVTDSIAVSLAATTALATVTPMEDGSQRPGYWTENEEVLNKDAAAAVATTKPQEQKIPAGYEADPTEGRITFLIYSLSADDVDATATPGTASGSYNNRYGTDYYITLSMDRVKTTGNIYARLVSKQNGFIEEIEIPENTARHQFQTIANGPKDKKTFTFRMSSTTLPFTDSTGKQTSVRYVNINSGQGDSGKGSVAYSLLTDDRTSYNSYTGVAPSYLPIQVTSYYVKETERRAQELLASYAHVAMVSGDSFTISDAAEFANYELIEAPVIKETPVSTNYSVGTPLIQYFPASKSARVIYVAKEDGTARFLNFVLNPDHPDFIENFKNYHSMSAVDFNTNGGAEALDFTNRIAIVNKYLAEIEAVNADTSLTSDQQASRLAEIRANYASEINTDDNKFLLTFVSTEAEPQSANDGPDAVTGLTTWTHTVKNYYTLYSNGNLVTTIAFKIGSYMSDPMVDWSPTDPTPQGAKLHSKTELDKDGIAARVNITVNQDGVEKEVGADLQSNIIAMYNMLTANENNQNYYYAEKGGVKVYYVDSTGKEIKDPQFVYEHTDTHTAYDTETKFVDKIEYANGDGTTTVYYYKEIDKANLKPASSNTDTEKRKIEKITEEVGTVAQDTLKELTYVYEKAGNVIVHYVTEDGTELSGTTDTGATTAATVNDTTNGKPGETYDTKDLKPKTITTADGKTYALVEASTKGEETGTVEAGKTKEVTYVYKEVKGNVVVKYVDVNGNPISGTADKGVDGKEKEVASEVEDTPLSSTTNTGNGYDTTDNRPNTITTADGKVYKLVPAATQGNEAGDIVEGTTTVTYVYELLQGDVIVHYVDTEGNTIADDVTDQTITDTGTDYDTKDNKPEKIVNDKTGDVYYILPKDEVKAGDKETGKVVEGTTEVTYIYEKAGSVNVNYVDTEGNVLKDPVADVTDGKPGSGYDTVLDNKLASISVDGKLYRLAPANTYNVGTVSGDNNLTAVGNGKATGIDATTGTVEAGKTKEITYVYEEVKGDVVVEYYDTEGNTIAKTEVDTPTTSVDTPYETYDHKPATITVVEKDGSETIYYYKEVKDTSAPEKGDVVEGTTTVQYVYEKAGNVNVNYVDTEGNPIQAPVADETNEKAGTEYATADNKPTTITTADGKTYRLVEAGTYNVGTVSDDNNLTAVGNGTATGVDSETGTVEAGVTKEITYVYQEVKGDVIVEYYDTEGNQIAKTVVDEDDKSVGTVYNTDEDNKPETITTEDGTVYYYKEVKDTSAPTTGKVVETTTTVQYVYEKAGSVNVNYVDVNGTEIKADVLDVENGKPGSDYDTLVDNRPDTIVAKDGKTYKLVPAGDYPVGTVAADSNLASDDTPTGTVEAGVTKEVTYVYQEVKGDVIVHYVDQDGNPISGTTDDGKQTASTVTDTPESSTGTPYNTTDLRPNTITTADGKIYKRVPAATIGKEDGKVVEGTTEVTYVYELLQGDVIVHYVDTEGNTIADDVTDQVITDTGTEYDTRDNKPEKIVNDETGDVYYILPKDEVKAGDKETGKVVEGTTEVTYIYEKAGSVNVNYVDTEGNVLKDPVADVTDGKPGSGYDTVLDNKLASISVDGKLYRRVPAGTYNVGTVSDDNNLTAVGNGKATGIDATTGTVEAGVTKEVTYVYQEVKGDVVVEYYDTEGNQIAKTVVDEDDKSVGTVYNTDEDNKPEKITTEDGTVYYYKEVKDTSAPTTGKVAETTTTVQYVYEKAGSVNVNYVDTDGNPIQAPVADETNEKAGTEYATADNKPTTITTADGKTYRLVEAGTYNVGTVSDDNNLTAVGNGKATGIDATTGTVEAGTTKEITYVYEEVKGNVVVNYITTDGTVIKQPVEDTPSTSTGTPYDTKDNKPTTITTEDGKTYRIVPVLTKGSETGKVVEGTTTITYVYEEVKGDVVVEYYDTEGNLISGLSDSGEAVDTKEVDTPSTSTGTAYNTDEDHKPNTITTADGTVYYYKEVKDTSASTTGKVVEGTTTVQYVYEKAGNVIVHYITEDGTVIKATVTDEENAKPGKSYDTTDNKPTEIVTEDGSRYVLIPSKTIGSETGTVEGGKTIEITYVYKKVANWIPQIPGVPAGEEPKVPYPFDPTTPDKPIDPTTPYPDGEVPSIPNVPGYTPVDPKTNEPLKPVDPTDPGKGYVPPTPDDSGVDTPIPYVQNGNVVVNYVDENGNVLKTPVNDETDAPAGKSYDTTDNKPNTITTEDGTTYELVRVEGSETGTVVGGKTTEVTYVYRKVETPAKKVVTNHVDEDGNPIAPQEEGTTPNKSIPGYEFTGKTVTDPDGNTTHIYRKVSKPVAPKPQAPVAPTTAKAGAAQLPNTGEASSSATVLGAAMLVAAIALAGKRRRNED
ncbi:MucBP domain-containing protein [Streptococcus suis]|uniref:MucBP domain-containing protein n=1 Tax=Streptococcus suis TaxID=1307 RepID=UPI0037D60482